MNKVFRVAVNLPLPRLFDYSPPDHLCEITIGSIVLVPFSTKQKLGVVVEVATTTELPQEQIRPIAKCLPYPALPESWLKWLQFASSYYQVPLGLAVHSVLPRLDSKHTSLPVKLEQQPFWIITHLGRHANESSLAKTAIKQRLLLVAFQQSETGMLTMPEIASIVGKGATAILKRLEALSLVEKTYQHVSANSEDIFSASSNMTNAYFLNADQQHAVDAVATFSKFGVFLLEGVTGSGKTEVYLHIAAKALKEKKQVLFLVPEIHLTPQFARVVEERFKHARVVVLNSSVSNGQRLKGWLQAQAGEADIILGTRLSLFTPTAALGLIVIDEEHDTSYKQQEGMRYSARDLAIWRAKQLNVPIVLGSATPSLESLHQVSKGHYQHLVLSRRAVAAALPKIYLINTQKQRTHGLSETLCASVAKRLAAAEQSLIFINRRGYAPVISCPSCGWMAECIHCSVRMVYHLTNKLLQCHYCGYSSSVMSSCPSCGEQDLKALGRGTQRLERVLAEQFPTARILRVDKDTTRRKDAFKTMLTAIHNGEVDILLGTQMLAKGHDFSRLTLVGIIDADLSLFAPDFRASERLFGMLLQVAGRAGRAGLPGEVFIQTNFAKHDLYLHLIKHNYSGFAKKMLQEREEVCQPPFVYQAILRAEAEHLGLAIDFLVKARSIPTPFQETVTIFDAVPMLLSRKAGFHRAQLLLESPRRMALQNFLKQWVPNLYRLSSRSVRWHIDVDPIEVT